MADFVFRFTVNLNTKSAIILFLSAAIFTYLVSYHYTVTLRHYALCCNAKYSQYKKAAYLKQRHNYYYHSVNGSI